MVGLDDVTFLGLDPGEVTTVHVESVRRPAGCPTCGSVAQLKDRADVDRFGGVRALGLDEALMVRLGTFRTQQFST